MQTKQSRRGGAQLPSGPSSWEQVNSSSHRRDPLFETYPQRNRNRAHSQQTGGPAGPGGYASLECCRDTETELVDQSPTFTPNSKHLD